MMKILVLGDVVGREAIAFLNERLRAKRASLGADFVIVNGENATDVHGLSKTDAEALFDAGADLLTLGNHTYGMRDLYVYLDDNADRVIRPANYPADAPGVGYAICCVNGYRLLVANLLGNVFLDPLDSPFAVMDKILAREEGKYDFSLLDFHAEATSEKMAMGRYLDGRVSAVWGTHTHIPTADTRILPHGTAYVTDIGMTGPEDGILGTDTEAVPTRMIHHMPARFAPAQGRIICNGILLTLDTAAKKVCAIERIDF